MNEDLMSIIDKELDNIDISMDEANNSNLSNDISNLAHEQNEKIMKDRMKKEIINELKETGADTAYSDDMKYETLEEILNDNK